MTTKKQREERRNAQLKLDEGYAIMVPNWVTRDYKKIISKIFGEEVLFQELSEKLNNLDWFGSGLELIKFESKVDSNGYFYSIRIYRDHNGHDKIDVIEKGCVKLINKWVIHPERGYKILEGKTFASNEELSFILNSPFISRKLSGETFPDISIWIDKHSYEYIVDTKL